MTEVKVKTHLIITDIHNEYDVHWCGKMKDADPVMKNGMPVFIIQAEGTWLEMNTWDFKEIERICKKITNPRGREAVTTDQARIYLKENNGNKRIMGVVNHAKVKTFAPMYDKVGWE